VRYSLSTQSSKFGVNTPYGEGFPRGTQQFTREAPAINIDNGIGGVNTPVMGINMPYFCTFTCV